MNIYKYTSHNYYKSLYISYFGDFGGLGVWQIFFIFFFAKLFKVTDTNYEKEFKIIKSVNAHKRTHSCTPINNIHTKVRDICSKRKSVFACKRGKPASEILFLQNHLRL